jgi:two-component system chemotaxis response regulator CheY
MRCLIADDDFAARTLLHTYLSPVANCVVVKDGIETVEAFRKGIENDKPFDLICLDIMMPNMNGHEALKKIRQIEKDNGRYGISTVKVIMTTALGDSDNVTGAFGQGAQAYMVKPILKAKLYEGIESIGLILELPA